jgi:Nucleolar GTP-binding protein 1 (NOG1)
MEKLTFASLAHLPTAVIFVIDPTGLSGEKSTLLAQLNVRKHLKERFPKRPWLDVVSKGTCECVCAGVCVCACGCVCERAGVYVRACVRVSCIVCFHSDVI